MFSKTSQRCPPASWLVLMAILIGVGSSFLSTLSAQDWSANVCVNPRTGTYVAILNVWGNFYEKQKAYRSKDGITWEELDSEHFTGGHPIGRIILARMSREAVAK